MKRTKELDSIAESYGPDDPVCHSQYMADSGELLMCTLSGPHETHVNGDHPWTMATAAYAHDSEMCDFGTLILRVRSLELRLDKIEGKKP